MSYHVETTLCHDITTYDIPWQPYKACVYTVNHVDVGSKENKPTKIFDS